MRSAVSNVEKLKSREYAVLRATAATHRADSASGQANTTCFMAVAAAMAWASLRRSAGVTAWKYSGSGLLPDHPSRKWSKTSGVIGPGSINLSGISARSTWFLPNGMGISSEYKNSVG